MRESLASLQQLNSQVWVQAAGRLLSQASYGLINFYIPILFVNQLGFSATAVGFSIGLCAVTEIAGHFIGGTVADSPRLGRRLALMIAAGLGILVSLGLAFSATLLSLTLASLLLGISLGFYWTASSAAVMDATAPDQRPQAFALLGVTEYLGVGLGVLGGGWVLRWVEETPQQVFGCCALVFLAFLLLIQFAATSRQPDAGPARQSVWVALKDRALLLFVGANVFYSTYVALVTSTVPLYFTNFVAGSDSLPGVSVSSTANLFTWCYIGLGALVQIPLTQALAGLVRVRVLLGAVLLWALGFSLLWAAGSFAGSQFVWAIVGLGLMAIASVTYKPFSVAIVSDLAPVSLRGAYMAVSSQAWTIGYFVGPILGGWAMDQSPQVAHLFWLGTAASTVICVGLLVWFEAVSSAGVGEMGEMREVGE